MEESKYANENDENLSLDQKKKEITYVYLKHICGEEYKITSTAAEKSALLKEALNVDDDDYGETKENPIIINETKNEVLPFILAYLNYHDGKEESLELTKPLPKIHISYILGDEYVLFSKIYDESMTVDKKLQLLNDHLYSSVYFDIPGLSKKICAIVASVICGIKTDALV